MVGSVNTGTSHIIGLPSTVRALLLERTSLVSFDLRVAFWSLYVPLAASLGICTTHAESYLANRTDYHAEWASVTGYSNPDDFKQIALSFLTGATLSNAAATRATKLLGRDAMTKFRQQSSVQVLYKEVRDGMTNVVHYHKKHSGKQSMIVNALGKELLVTGSPSDLGKSASFLLIGLEQHAIREICTKVTGLRAVIYDCVVADQQTDDSLVTMPYKTTIDGVSFSLTLTATSFKDHLVTISPDLNPSDF